MSPLAYIENIAWCVAFVLCALLLDDWWKMLSLVPIMCMNGPKNPDTRIKEPK